MKVNFMIIGAMKCGTSTMYDILKTHPEVGMSYIKEPNFFSLDKDWQNNLGQYEKYFKEGGHTVYGEASTSYTFRENPELNPHVWEILHAYNPDLKLIYIVRDPIDRIVSHYVHTYQRGYTTLPFSACLREMPELVSRTLYYYQISPYFNLFGPEQMKLLWLEDLVADASGTLREVAEFLGIDPEGFNFEEAIHSNSWEENTLHYRWDNLIKNRSLQWAKPLVPKKIIRDILNLFSGHSSQSIDEKPVLTPEDRHFILSQIEADRKLFEALAGRPFLHKHRIDH